MRKDLLSSVIAATLAAGSMSAAVIDAVPATGLNLAKRELAPVSTNVRPGLALSDFATTMSAAPKAEIPTIGEETGWKSVGTGTYVEGWLNNLFSDVAIGEKWEVEFFESETTPGVYKFVPYGTADCVFGTAISQEPMILHTELGADKVYIENFELALSAVVSSWPDLTLSQITTQTGWPKDIYGTLADNIATFPSESMRMGLAGKYYTGEFGVKIGLPGADIKDYRLIMEAPYCAKNNEVSVSIAAGSDVKTVKTLFTSGDYTNGDPYDAVVVSNGSVFDHNQYGGKRLGLTKNGIYTLLAVALDADDKLVSSAYVHVYGVLDEDDKWENIGDGDFTDPFLPSLYTDITKETYKVAVQKSKETDGFYRIVNPYANHPSADVTAGLQTDHNHNHYIYLHAEDPDHVYITDSPVGLEISYGSVGVNSQVGGYMEKYTPEQIIAGLGNDYFGKMNDNTVTFPVKNSLLASESGYENGKWYAATPDFMLTIPTPASIAAVAAEAEAAPAEYFNIQGIKVANPKGLVIRRQGDKVEKVVL